MSNSPKSFDILELTPGDSLPRRTTLDSERLALLPVGNEQDGSTVMVMSLEDLTNLLKLVPGKLLVDRGTQNVGRALPSYLARSSGFVALRAKYSNAARARLGLLGLLQAASRYRTRTSYFIGVDKSIFTALAQSALPGLPTEDVRSDSSHDLNLLLKGTIVEPASLRAAYLGASEKVEWVRRSIVLVARIDHPVLIQGETGTGKEVVARQIHDLSRRASESFVPVNGGGIPTELFESELFGHVRGAFSGAYRDKKGFWTLADKGTLFLDEIGDLSLYHQVKVLRALEDGSYYPVGSENLVRSHARVIAATNRDLDAMVRNGQFREDLYYRLFTFRIRTPTLAEHPGDIPQLARHFWAKIGDGSVPALTRPVTDTLARWHWPGNSRELRAFLINLLSVANGHKIDVPLVHAVMRERLGSTVSKRKTL